MSRVSGRPLTKGQISRERNGEIVSVYPFQFNPTEFRRATSTEYVFSRSPASALPIALFSSISEDNISFSLMLDSLQDFPSRSSTRRTRSLRGVVSQQAEIESWGLPDLEDIINEVSAFISPPLLRLSLGVDQQFTVRLTSRSFNDIMFSRDLRPVRSIADLNFERVHTDQAELISRYNIMNNLRGLANVDTTGR